MIHKFAVQTRKEVLWFTVVWQGTHRVAQKK